MKHLSKNISIISWQRKYALAFFLLISGHFVIAQVSPIPKQIERIDSLILYSNLVQANVEANQVLKILSSKTNTKENVDLKLAVMLHKANIFGLQEDHAKAIEVALSAIDLAIEFKLPKRAFKAYLLTALAYEVSGDYVTCKAYLDKANALYNEHRFNELYSSYCIRTSSYYRITGIADSSLQYAYEGLHYAKRYKNLRDISDAYMLLSILLNNTDYNESIKFASLAAKEFLQRNDYAGVAIMHSNISKKYQQQKEYDKAFRHNDTALLLCKKHSLPNALFATCYNQRHKLYESIGNEDSAYFYFKAYHNAYLGALKDQEATEIQRVTERYQNDKREAQLKSKDQQLFLIISLLVVIVAAAIVVIIKNRKIQIQNKIIRKQLDDLTKMLEQKELLLSELQHRVKNNLQHVISILEIQRESVNFNNIDEIIRGNQNRIHSIALLHKKLNVADSVNEICLTKYILELAELVKTSYSLEGENISLNVNCDIEVMSIEKALPVGLIIVELISNSMKHAFNKPSEGAIHISLMRDEVKQTNILYYADNGPGFDLDKTGKKGLGIEIIEGLVDQLNGTIETRNSNGFEQTIYFK